MKPLYPSWRTFLLRIVLPTSLTLVLFSLAIVLFILPAYEQNLMKGKKEMLRELTSSALSVIEEYHTEAEEGGMDEKEARQKAAERIRFMRYGEDKKDYFWITDMTPEMIMHPYRQDLEGQDLSDFTDPAGTYLFVEHARVASKEGQGFVNYMWQWKDDSSRIVPKLSYVEYFQPWQWIVGTGIYLEDVQRELSEVRKTILTISLTLFTAIVILQLIIAQQGLLLQRRRMQAERGLRESQEKYRLLVESLSQGVVMILGDVISFANPVFHEMTGYSMEELNSMDITAIIEAPDCPGSEDTTAPRECEGRVRRKDGTSFDALLQRTVTSSADRKGIIITVKDLSTDHHERDKKEVESRERIIADLQMSQSFLYQPVHLLQEKAVTALHNESVATIANRMTTAESDAALILSDNGVPLGMLTDSDLRSRLLAQNEDLDQDAARVMTAPLVSIDAKALLFEALAMMDEKKIQHLLVKESDPPALIHARDMVRTQRYSPAVVIGEVERCRSGEELKRAHNRVPSMVSALVKSGVRSGHITRTVSTVSDAIVRKSIELALEKKGDAPVPFTFIIYGSEGREEQTLVTDQDNAIIFEDVPARDLEKVQLWFLEFGQEVNETLHHAGYAYCNGEKMAKNPKWCQPLSRWKIYYRDWITTSEPQDLLEVNILFDFRPVYGEGSLASELRYYINDTLQENPGFFIHMTRNALQDKVPVGMFGKIVVESGGDHPETFNIKSAIVPLVNCVRIYALRYNLFDTNTEARLTTLNRRGYLQDGDFREIQMVYDHLMQLRLRHQVDAMLRGDEPDNYLKLEKLTEMEISHLRQDFSRVSAFQSRLSYEFLGHS